MAGYEFWPLRLAQECTNDSAGYWSFGIVADLPDEDAPYRSLLAQLARACPQALLRLPDQTPHEDCVDGSLIWDNEEILVSYEHILNYCQLSSPNREILQDVMSVLLALAGRNAEKNSGDATPD